MKVKELIEQLQQEDPDRLVICQKDPEGNGYSPLVNFWYQLINVESRKSRQINVV